ncbi:MAG: hypothetical protein WCN98_21190, partial [Verrucomicrobiaceae bacterium]
MSDEARSGPEVIRLLGQHMPDEHRQLPGNCHGGHLMAALGSDAHEKGVQRSGRLRGCPGRLHQHRAGVTAPDLADPAMVGSTQAGLTHPRIKTEIAHQLLGATE